MGWLKTRKRKAKERRERRERGAFVELLTEVINDFGDEDEKPTQQQIVAEVEARVENTPRFPLLRALLDWAIETGLLERLLDSLLGSATSGG